MIEEIWKDIKNFEGLYQISSLGRVKSLDRYKVCSNGMILHTHERILSQHIKYGHGSLPRYQVNLCKDGKNHMKLVSRLVAIAFIPNPNNLPQVNHIDENPANNVVTNLEWCTAKYNHNYGTRNERNAKSLQKRVAMYDVNMNHIKNFESIKDAAAYINGDASCITKVCKNKSRHHKGYIFKYI